MEYTGTGRPNPARTASYKAFDVSDFSITVYPSAVYNLTKKYCLDKVADQNEIWLAITKIDWSLQV